MTVSTLLLSRAENRETMARQSAEVVDRLRGELAIETNPALRVSLECRIAIRKGDRDNDAAAARLYRKAAEQAKGLE